MSGLLSQIYENTPDRTTVPANEKYELEIVSAKFGSTKGAEEKDDQKGKPKRPIIRVFYDIVDHPHTYPVSDMIWFPVADDKDSVKESQADTIKSWQNAIGYDPDEHGDTPEWKPDMEDEDLPGLVGLRCFATLNLEEYEGEERNKIKRYHKPE